MRLNNYRHALGVLVFTCLIVACGGGGGGGNTLPPSQTATPQPTSTPTPTGKPTATPTPSAAPTSRPTSTPTPTSAPTATPIAEPTTAPNSCSQTPQPGSQAGGITDQAGTFFEAVASAHQVCISIWEPSGEVQRDLTTAAENHAAVTVIYPVEEYGEDRGNASALAEQGARIIWEVDNGETPPPSPLPSGESTVSAQLPIHAKFALVDGVAYVDGHNFFSSDVLLRDANAADYAAIQTDLTSFPPSPPSVSTTAFTTDKYDSLDAEAALIGNANAGAGSTVDFISEDFDDYGTPAEAVYGALRAAAQHGATVNVIVEGPASDFDDYETCDLNTLAASGAHVYLGSGGSEKITLIGPSGGTPTSAWIGSSNMSDYDFIDWGMTVTDAPVIAAMQSYYATALANASSYSASPPNSCTLIRGRGAQRPPRG